MKKAMALIAGTALLLSASLSSALEIRGTQIRGNAGRNAEIKSATVKLVKSAKIVKIEGGKEGLCIQSPAETPLCGMPNELVGEVLKPGSYTTYPNLPKGVDQYSVTVYLK